ncbi:MFS general substrate transporter [Exidia glandulosa HHB12029]|uniref:MFS general substrate transporter n=1 Tax=Exidia glandulosa HHB12029 TaxID=1314781 RepID=A0A166NKK9_EXIGL|nr:MFS general substrate transporter [Exidia glandulosa HHB12029]
MSTSISASPTDDLELQKTSAEEHSPLTDEEKQQQKSNAAYDDTVPDGGRDAWLVILGCSALCFSLFGYILTWGSFQAYYQTVVLPDRSPSDVAWIGSLQYSLTFLPGLIAGRVFDLGYFRSSLMFSTVLYTTASFLIAECKEYWQFMLCQGVAIGFAGGWIYIPCVAVVSHWFKVKRPMAYGIISLGTSLGGIVFPIMFRALIPQIGFKWTVRTFGFINFFMFCVAILTLKTRIPPKGRLDPIDFRTFVSPGYVTYVLATFVGFLGIYTPMTFVTLSAEKIGIANALAFYMVAVFNATSGVGRVLGGGLAVKYGPINVMAIFTVFAAAFTYAWPYTTSQGAFIAVISLYGLMCGPFVGLFPAPVAQMGAAHDTGLRTGLQMTIMALGALAGPPIAGAIVGSKGDFKGTGIFAASTMLGAAVLMALSKVLLLKTLFSGRV